MLYLKKIRGKNGQLFGDTICKLGPLFFSNYYFIGTCRYTWRLNLNYVFPTYVSTSLKAQLDLYGCLRITRN